MRLIATALAERAMMPTACLQVDCVSEDHDVCCLQCPTEQVLWFTCCKKLRVCVWPHVMNRASTGITGARLC